MNEVLFDKAIIVSWTAIAGEKPVTVAEIRSARVYTAVPTSAQLADHTATIGDDEVSTTTSSDFVKVGNHEWEITLPEIANPDADLRGGHKLYYLAVSYRYVATTGTTAATWQALPIFYPNALTSRIGLQPFEISRINTQFEEIRSLQFIQDKIQLAETLVFKHLDADGIERRRLDEESVRELVRYRTAWLCAEDITSQPGDVHSELRDEYKETYHMLFKSCRIAYDGNKDGIIEPGDKLSTAPKYVMV